MYSKKLEKIVKETTENTELFFKNNQYPLALLINNIVEEKDVHIFLESKNIDTNMLHLELKLLILEKSLVEADSCIRKDTDLEVINVVMIASLNLKSIASDRPLEITEYDILEAAVSNKCQVSQILLSLGINCKLLNQKTLQDEEHFSTIDDLRDYKESKPDAPNNKYAVNSALLNLNEKSKNKNCNKLIGRESEINRIITIISRKTKNNPIIIGAAGVGKTAIIEGLAKKIENGDVIDNLKGKTIYSVNIGQLVSGSKYRGDFEEKVQNIINKVKKEKAILFIDEIHLMIGAGSVGGTGSSNDMMSMIMGSLIEDDFIVIGATTSSEYISLFCKNEALNRRFSKVEIKELSSNETIEIMNIIKKDYESFHGVSYEIGVVEKIVQLTGRYIKERSFPDKALDLFDEIAARVKTDKSRKIKVATKKDVFKALSDVLLIPYDILKDAGSNSSILNLNERISKFVYGQDEAVKKISDTMMMAYSGLKRRNKPIGSFLCLGPTGVGKTEMAKTLARELSMKLIRFDMSEYMSQTSANRFLGADPGYVGYEKGGVFLEKLKNNPFSVVLFDEFEKAHESIQNIFLQILDEGEIKDSQGRTICFKNSIIILTSNAGVARTNQKANGIGFHKDENKSTIDMDDIKKIFSPEFLNRLSGIIEFKSLGRDIMCKVARKGISEVQSLLKENRGVTLEWTKGVEQVVAEQGFDATMGARPIERKIEELISKKIATMIMKDGLTTGSKIKISKDDGSDLLTFEVTKEKV